MMSDCHRSAWTAAVAIQHDTGGLQNENQGVIDARSDRGMEAGF